MEIIRGRDKGKEVEISQWCNDWFSANGKIYSVLSVKLNLKEIYKVLTHNNNGSMFGEFELLSNGRFKRIKKG